MKVYVLKEVLCDYTCGCIVVSARNEKHALARIRENNGECSDIEHLTDEELLDKLEEVTEDYYYYVYGGS